MAIVPFLQPVPVKMGRCFGHCGGEETDIVAVGDGIFIVVVVSAGRVAG